MNFEFLIGNHFRAVTWHHPFLANELKRHKSHRRSPEFKIQNSRFKIILLLAIALFISLPAAADLAVFTDGRFLKVEDAYIEGDRIVLLLPESGQLIVPALRIDRVVKDEVIDTKKRLRPTGGSCLCAWVDHELPEDLPFAELIAETAHKSDLHPALLASLVRAESNFDAFAMSRVGAAGLTQLMPSAASDRGVSDVWDPAQNLGGGARHLRLLLDRFESLPLALAAYNAGAGTVDRYGGIPPYRETQDYVEKIMQEFCPEPT